MKFMENKPLRSRMMWSFMWVTILALLGAIVRFYGVYHLGVQVHELGATRLNLIGSLLTISQAQTSLYAADQTLLNPRSDRETRQFQMVQIAEAQGRLENAWTRFNSVKKDETDSANADQLVKEWQYWKDAHVEFLNLAKEREKISAPNDPRLSRLEQDMSNAFSKTHERFLSVQKLLQPMVKFNEDAARRIQQEATTSERVNNFFSWMAVVVGFIIAVIFALVLSRGIADPVKRVARALASGAENATTTAEQVSNASQQLAGGAAEQAASLEETSASLEQMASMTKKNAENAQFAKDQATQARTVADTGTVEMKELNEVMESIKVSMSEMNNAMNAIKTSSGDISKIIKTIDEIAFQTNILALNAAVEAARAGEAGMGFAVVADEVRGLAQRSAQAAKETAEKIEDSIRNSEHGVRSSEKVGHDLLAAVQKATDVDHRLKEIVSRVHRVDELVAEIAVASQEQSQGITQIDNAVNQMDRVTQSNAANAEQTASASEELKVQAAALKNSVRELVALAEGSEVRETENLPFEETKPAQKLTATPVPNPAPAAAAPAVKVTVHTPSQPDETRKAGRNKLTLSGEPRSKRQEADEKIPMGKDFRNIF
ncbi:MAG: methyl-accepting chemotaxis protein [Verrucomicrobiae bacterium]|nr:methyl-accepting chemotaxis protein [Verrucomicrobiae bacterium]